MPKTSEDVREEPLPVMVATSDISESGEQAAAPTSDISEPGEQAVAANSVKLPSLWRNRDFMLLWSGQLVSGVGSGISSLAFPLITLAISGSALITGIVTATFTLPLLFFSLPVGALMDRLDRKRVMIICDIIRATNMASIGLALTFGVLTVGQIFINAFIEGSASVFFNIAQLSALPRVVGKEQLPSAMAQNEASGNLTSLISGPVGGFIYQSVGRIAPFLIDAVSYAASVGSLLFIRTKFQLEREATKPHLWAEIKEGLGWLWHQKVVRFLAMLTSGINLAFAGNELITIVLAQRLGADSSAIGTIFGIGAVGGLLGATIAARVQKHLGFALVVRCCIWVWALLTPLLLLAPNIFVLGAIEAGLFIVGPLYNVTVGSYRLALTPDHLQGRVSSASRLITWGSLPLGAAVAGALLQFGAQLALGPLLAIAFLTIVMLACALVATFSATIHQMRPINQIEIN